jgi:hypothetical protein
MRRIVLFVATAAVVLAASAGTALADGQQVCIGGPGTAVSTPNSSGQCKKTETLTTLATQSEVTDLQSRVTTLETANTDLTNRVSALESTLSKVSYTDSGLNGKPTLKISGANLQIVSGSGATDGTLNGEGNLIIGYDENCCGLDQSGSNNLVLGKNQTFTSYGGLIAGQSNTLAGPFADAFGELNTASGSDSSVSGGDSNIANGTDSSVSGGYSNTASGGDSSVSGGASNTASRGESSVSGGYGNTASGGTSSVSGGYSNTASGEDSSVLGGDSVTVSSDYGTSP